MSSVVVPYAAYLRVYEPLGAFPEPERSHWARYARRPDRPSYQDELRRSLADLLPIPPVAVPVHESSDAFVLEIDGVVCVCPWRTRLRGWQALGELAEELPPAGAGRGAPAGGAPAGGLGLRALAGPQPRRPAVDPNGHLAGPAELVRAGLGRGAAVRQGDRRGAPRCCVTARRWCRPRRRVARALRTLRDTVEEGPLVDGVTDVGRWLEEFHPRSLVELDYGGLVHMLPAGELEGDHSAADVAAGIEALRRGTGGPPGRRTGGWWSGGGRYGTDVLRTE